MPHVEILLSDEVVEMLQAINEQCIDVEGAFYRVDETGEQDCDRIRKLIDVYREPPHPHLCVRETKLDPVTGTKTNPHYHGFMFIEKGKMNALRAAMKRLWPGNKGYSLKKNLPEKTPGYFNYMCKGTGTGSDDKPDILHSSEHFTEELIGNLNSIYWKNKTDIQANSKKRKTSIHEDILLRCQQRNIAATDRRAIFKIIHEYYRKRIKYLNPSYVRNLVFQTAVYLDPVGPAVADLETYCISYPFVPQ